MTTFRPCFGCTVRNECEIKKAAVKALRGHPVTLAKIKCDLPWTKFFPPGTRALVMVWDHRDVVQSYDGEWRGEPIMAPATVIGKSTKKPGKLLLHLDTKIMTAQETEIEFRAAWPKEVSKLDEPLRDVCEICGRGVVNGRCDHPDDDAFNHLGWVA